MSDVTQPAGAAPDSGRRRLKYALIASLALNLLVIGAVAGTMYSFRKHHPRPPGGEDFGMMGLTRVLPEERRKEVRKALRADRERLRPLMEEVRVARRAAADKLALEPFDRAGLEAAIAAVGEKERAVRDAAVATFLGHAEKLTGEERAKLAEWWRKKSEAPRRKKSADDKGDKGDKDEDPPPPPPPPAP